MRDLLKSIRLSVWMCCYWVRCSVVATLLAVLNNALMCYKSISLEIKLRNQNFQVRRLSKGVSRELSSFLLVQFNRDFPRFPKFILSSPLLCYITSKNTSISITLFLFLHYSAKNYCQFSFPTKIDQIFYEGKPNLPPKSNDPSQHLTSKCPIPFSRFLH